MKLCSVEGKEGNINVVGLERAILNISPTFHRFAFSLPIPTLPGKIWISLVFWFVFCLISFGFGFINVINCCVLKVNSTDAFGDFVRKTSLEEP